jgi:hypothetical protein
VRQRVPTQQQPHGVRILVHRVPDGSQCNRHLQRHVMWLHMQFRLSPVRYDLRFEHQRCELRFDVVHGVRGSCEWRGGL